MSLYIVYTYLGQVDPVSLELLGGLGVLWLQGLAVPAPGGVKLDQDQVLEGKRAGVNGQSWAFGVCGTTEQSWALPVFFNFFNNKK